mmetsp:Transcript_6046/g.9133  ORF Transcript_6046/g.9133 Transcript_6046/m.9133 type:complete len:112 (+) Transcript_6046:143-478(+)|eukprot:CAMPEP_0185032514 /NCGR_PEP_ID=MMETSP1103-20130426/20665_1 /TAXON_ID=36769 /ORGANISM="Paraphysomonas bandaiensis, Strain Caron Lab Isolate" /LENGTH=111 /DNA_ID=CAMNT_0027568447 /DNA_START=78 /DNA_END=413 /DNA_ORIENTATION=+
MTVESTNAPEHHVTSKIYVHGLPSSVTVRDVIDLFSNCGVVTSAVLDYRIDNGNVVTTTGGATLRITGPLDLESRVADNVSRKIGDSDYSNLKVVFQETTRTYFNAASKSE